MLASRSPSWFAVALTVFLIVGCGGSVAPVTDAPAEGFPADFPFADYQERAGRIYRVTGSGSELLITVYRGGPLARFGHDHVVHHASLGGMVAVPPSLGDVRADLFVAVTELVVDDPGRRAEAGFDSEPSAEDIAGTRANMLGPRVLNAAEYPFVRVAVEDVTGELPEVELALALVVAGATTRMTTSATVDISRCSVSVSAALSLRQTELGLEPFSVLGGALRVADEFDVRLRLLAESPDNGCGAWRSPPPSESPSALLAPISRPLPCLDGAAPRCSSTFARSCSLAVCRVRVDSSLGGLQSQGLFFVEFAQPVALFLQTRGAVL